MNTTEVETATLFFKHDISKFGIPTVHEAQIRHLCWAFPFMFYSLPNIFRKESRYFLEYLNKFPFMVIVSNLEK